MTYVKGPGVHHNPQFIRTAVNQHFKRIRDIEAAPYDLIDAEQKRLQIENLFKGMLTLTRVGLYQMKRMEELAELQKDGVHVVGSAAEDDKHIPGTRPKPRRFKTTAEIEVEMQQ